MKADKKKMESAAAALESDYQADIQESSAATKELLRRDAEIDALKIKRDMIKEEATAWKTRRVQHLQQISNAKYHLVLAKVSLGF
ncbi:hypothetical protein PRIC2_006713 [Phytophthora ramorum]